MIAFRLLFRQPIDRLIQYLIYFYFYIYFEIFFIIKDSRKWIYSFFNFTSNDRLNSIFSLLLFLYIFRDILHSQRLEKMNQWLLQFHDRFNSIFSLLLFLYIFRDSSLSKTREDKSMASSIPRPMIVSIQYLVYFYFYIYFEIFSIIKDSRRWIYSFFNFNDRFNSIFSLLLFLYIFRDSSLSNSRRWITASSISHLIIY